MTNIVIPKSVTKVGCSKFRSIGSLFSGCVGLTRIVVEEGNEKYDSRNNCNAIIETGNNTLIAGCCSTIIPEDIEVIKDRAFACCEELTDIIIPQNVRKIGKSAFEDCENLKSVVISQSVTEIGEYAFSDCRELTDIVIPKSVKTVGNSVFRGCKRLVKIVVEEGNERYESPNNCNAIVDKENKTLVAGCSASIIPDGVEIIGYGAFMGNQELVNIVLPNSIRKIDGYAFESTGLKEIIIPECVVEIYDGAFKQCNSLTSIIIPETVEELSTSAFRNCESLKSIEIKGKMKLYDGRHGRAFCNCTSLETIIFHDCVTKMSPSEFMYCNAIKSIYVPAKKVEYYQKRLDERLHPFIIEMEPVRKTKKK